MSNPWLELLQAAREILASLEWEERLSGITYAGYENLITAVARAEREE